MPGACPAHYYSPFVTSPCTSTAWELWPNVMFYHPGIFGHTSLAHQHLSCTFKLNTGLAMAAFQHSHNVDSELETWLNHIPLHFGQNKCRPAQLCSEPAYLQYDV